MAVLRQPPGGHGGPGQSGWTAIIAVYLLSVTLAFIAGSHHGPNIAAQPRVAPPCPACPVAAAVQQICTPCPTAEAKQPQCDPCPVCETCPQCETCPECPAASATTQDAAPVAAGGKLPSQPAVDAKTLKCMKKGEKYAAKVGLGSGDNNFNKQFVSPVTTARDDTFLRLAQGSGTDKVTGHAYHYIYSRYLPHARFNDLNVLEIGLGCNMGYGPGASLKLWRAYLPCSNISFLEYDAACSAKWKEKVEAEGGGKLYVGSQDDPAVLGPIVEDAKAFGGFDMIVDDGSHVVDHQWVSLQHLWAAIKPGGVYVVEDLHDYYFKDKDLDGLTATPQAVLPLAQRLIHTINCFSGAWHVYSKQTQEWCRNHTTSLFKNVVNVDCMPELCALVKGRDLAV